MGKLDDSQLEKVYVDTYGHKPNPAQLSTFRQYLELIGAIAVSG